MAAVPKNLKPGKYMWVVNEKTGKEYFVPFRPPMPKFRPIDRFKREKYV